MTARDLRLAGRLGWRNLWRNPRRSVITTLGVAAAFLILIVLIGLLGGVREQLLRNGTELMLGHLQVHHAEYLPDRHVADTIATGDLAGLLARVGTHPDIRALAPRVHADGLIASEGASAGGRLLGVDPEREGRVTVLLDDIDGDRLGGPGSHDIVLGADLAREIGAPVGSAVAVVVQAADGSLGNELFTVVGLIRTGLPGIDRILAVAHLADVQRLLALDGDAVHEVALLVGAPMAADAVAADLERAGLLPEPSRARSWGELAPQLRDYMAMSEGASGVIILVVALFAAFGVLNSMMMAVFERTREFGMLHAIGTRPALILLSLLTEAMLLAALGLAAGLAAGALVMRDMIGRGWDLTRWTGEMAVLGTRLDPVWRGVWQWDQVGWAAAGLAVAALIAVLIPASRILRLDPVAAMSAPTEA
jgi:ABC-type lipoprotein release transport system permease subunit